jgi:hypothetical protein
MTASERIRQAREAGTPWSVNVTSEEGPERAFTVWAVDQSEAFRKARRLYKLEQRREGIQLLARPF